MAKSHANARFSGQPIIAPATAPMAARAYGSAVMVQPVGVNHASARGVKNSQASQPPASANAGQGRGGAECLSLSSGLSSLAASAGLSVSELKAEMTVDTEMVNANCRKNCPVMPVMNAH